MVEQSTSLYVGWSQSLDDCLTELIDICCLEDDGGVVMDVKGRTCECLQCTTAFLFPPRIIGSPNCSNMKLSLEWPLLVVKAIGILVATTWFAIRNKHQEEE
eukprot:115945-Ditylum_brightwellii.AAC.1